MIVAPPAQPKPKPNARYPLVIALHGRGESLKGPLRGPWGWPRDYALTRAAARITAPPLTTTDYEGLITDERLARVNARLVERPFRGLVVVSPFLPDFDWARMPSELVESYGRFVTRELVPKARRELPVIATPASTGIDGVSLGGAMALRLGFKFASEFGAVGALQCAVNPNQVDALVMMARAARHTNPALALRIATSDEDAFVNTNRALSEALRSGGVAREFEEHRGPHDYVWNRGPGSYELLLFHDRALGG